MKLVTYREDNGTRAGLLKGDRVSPLPFASVDDLLRSGQLSDAESLVGSRGEELSLADLHLAPVVTQPSKIICLGLNYASHIAEMGRDTPTYPTLFAKFSDTLTGPTDVLELPETATEIDWEAELAIVIGRTAFRASPAEARFAIAGFTVLNDVTARDWQRRTSQWLQGKNFHASTPVGPALVTCDEIGEGDNLNLSCLVNDEVVQRASTSDLAFGPADTVAYISSVMTLRPGDVIATGTPGGVGAGMSPQRFLQDGDVLTTRIEGLGDCRNLFSRAD